MTNNTPNIKLNKDGQVHMIKFLEDVKIEISNVKFIDIDYFKYESIINNFTKDYGKHIKSKPLPHLFKKDILYIFYIDEFKSSSEVLIPLPVGIFERLWVHNLK